MNLLTNVLFPDTPDVIIEEVTIEDEVLIFSLRSTQLRAVKFTQFDGVQERSN